MALFHHFMQIAKQPLEGRRKKEGGSRAPGRVAYLTSCYIAFFTLSPAHLVSCHVNDGGDSQVLATYRAVFPTTQ